MVDPFAAKAVRAAAQDAGGDPAERGGVIQRIAFRRLAGDDQAVTQLFRKGQAEMFPNADFSLKARRFDYNLGGAAPKPLRSNLKASRQLRDGRSPTYIAASILFPGKCNAMSTTKPQLPDDRQLISLDKQGFIPLYYQIQQALLEKIERGELAAGDLLDSEEELARRYQVSRMTARQALHGLKSRGVAVSQKGRGTFVTRPKLEKNIMHLQGFTVDMRQRGMKPGFASAGAGHRVAHGGAMREAAVVGHRTRYCGCAGCGWPTAFPWRWSFRTSR